MNELLDVLRVQGARIGLKVNGKKAKLQRVGTREDEKVTLSKEKIDQVDTFTYLDSIINKDGGCLENAKSGIAKAQGVFFTVEKKFGRIRRYVYEPG